MWQQVLFYQCFYVEFSSQTRYLMRYLYSQIALHKWEKALPSYWLGQFLPTIHRQSPFDQREWVICPSYPWALFAEEYPDCCQFLVVGYFQGLLSCCLGYDCEVYLLLLDSKCWRLAYFRGPNIYSLFHLVYFYSIQWELKGPCSVTSLCFDDWVICQAPLISSYLVFHSRPLLHSYLSAHRSCRL